MNGLVARVRIQQILVLGGQARELSGGKLENSKSKSNIRMSDVIPRKAELHSHGAHIKGGTGSIGVIFNFIPKSIEIATCGSVPDDSVERIGDPVAGHSDIALQHHERTDRTDHQIVLYHVFGLYAVLYENVVALHTVAHVFLHQKIVCPVNRQDASVGIVDSNTANKAVGDLAGHMEMSAIPADYLRLPAVSELCVAERGIEAGRCLAVEHQMRTVAGFI
jgi:hypothetical protein